MSTTVLTPQDSAASRHQPWLWLLVSILLLRLLILPSLPLTDHTEARYAEIARLMLQLNDWISPHITPSEVFWAKPPLATWGQALSMGVFGVSAWAARLPALLWSVMALGALGWMLKGSLSRVQTLAALVVLALSPLFFISAGAAMTDATLAATTLFAQAAWWRVLGSDGAERRRMARWLGLGIGLALLTKGPAAAVLTLLPIFMHAAWRRHWPAVKAVAGDVWVWLICLGVALPWYVMAEVKTPGFIEYFVLGEHVMRFLQPGWTGDRYGFAHAQPLGIIWPYTFVAALPAALILLLRLPYLRIKRGAGALGAQFKQAGPGGTELACYALCISLAPLLLFTGARNLIWTYAMTALPGLAILAVMACSQATLARATSWGLGLALLLLYTWAFVFKLPQESQKHSDQALIAAYRQACPAWDCRLLYAEKPNYSAYFYSEGRLYTGLPGSASAPGYKVMPLEKNSPLRASALACNRGQCLLRDPAVASEKPAP